MTSIHLIDDDFILLLMLKQGFQQKGCLVTTFNNAESWFNSIKQKQLTAPDILLLDINMEPNWSGFELLEQISNDKLVLRLLGNTTLYMLSSSRSLNDLLAAKNFDFVKGFIHKPFESQFLERVLNKEILWKS